MPFNYTQELIDNAFTYQQYRNHITEDLAQAPKNEAAEKIRPYALHNAGLMEKYDHTYVTDNNLMQALETAPPTTWLVISEGWCGDAAFNVPLLALVEKALPEKVKLRIVLRDDNPELMDAHLTDGGRSIPKLIVLNKELEKLGIWGPRPAGLQLLMKEWKEEGLVLKDIIPKVQDWYDADETDCLQTELTALVKSYS